MPRRVRKLPSTNCCATRTERIAPYALLCALSLGLVEPASAQIAPTVAFAAGTVSALASAGAALVTVNRTGDASGAVIVSYTTIGGTAVAGTDYSATSCEHRPG